MLSLMRRGRRAFASTLALSVVALSTALASPVLAAGKTITAVMHSDLRIIDPIFTTAYITRDHGYMVYDTLIATDSNFKIQPQMADWKVSDDKLTYTFTLRDGLKWHDGAPVTAEDCVASLKRWAARRRHGPEADDFHGQHRSDRRQDHHAEAEGALRPRAGLDRQAVLARAFMMPKRLAETPPDKQIPEQIGSGPFKFVQGEFQPGVKAVYVKNTDYVPRKEPSSWTAGGKVVKVDRVEWITMPDSQTAVNALQSGDIDFMEMPPFDMLPVLEANEDLKVEILNKFGFQTLGRMNFLYPPFDNVEDPPCRLPGDEPEGRARRARRQPQILQDLRRLLHLRYAVRDRCRRRDRWSRATAWRKPRRRSPSPAMTARPSWSWRPAMSSR